MPVHETSLRRPLLIERALLLLALVLLLTGCDEVLVIEDVSQREATSIVAALNTQGIPAMAERASSGKGKYGVEVKRRDYTQAIAILAKERLPRPEEITFSELVAERGFLPSSREIEALRVDHAIALELQAIIESHPAVETAAVVVRAKADKQPSVAVVLTARPAMSVDRQTIVDILQRAVPGVDAERITVVINTAAPIPKNYSVEGISNEEGTVLYVPLVPFLLMWTVPENQYNGIALTWVSVLVAVGAVGAVAGYSLSSHQRFRESTRARAAAAEPALRSFSEGSFKEGSFKEDRVRRDLTEV